LCPRLLHLLRQLRDPTIPLRRRLIEGLRPLPRLRQLARKLGDPTIPLRDCQFKGLASLPRPLQLLLQSFELLRSLLALRHGIGDLPPKGLLALPQERLHRPIEDPLQVCDRDGRALRVVARPRQKDELVDVGIRQSLDEASDLRWDLLRASPKLRPPDGVAGRPHLFDRVAGAGEEVEDVLEAEEPEVGLVEEAHGGVPEFSIEEVDEDVAVADVRDRDDDAAMGLQVPPHLLEDGGRILQVLQDVPEDGHVYRGGSEIIFEVDLLHVSRDHQVAVLLGDLRRLAVDLDPDDPVSQVPEDAGEVAGGGPHLQDEVSSSDQLHYQGVAVVPVR